MSLDALKQNITRIKEVIRELYVFTNQLEIIQNLEKNKNIVINTREKKLLKDAVNALIIQLRILNGSLPDLVEGIGFFKKLKVKQGTPKITPKPGFKKPMIQIRYKPSENQKKVYVTISDKDRKQFLENLSKSNLSINQLKKKYAVEKPISVFGKPNLYAKISNRFFRDLSQKLLDKGYLSPLNTDLRKMNSPFVVGTYTSMIFFTMVLSLIASIILLVVLMFFHIGLTLPFISLSEEGPFLRFAKFFWIVFVIPFVTGVAMYFYPKSEGKTLGAKINQELPFVTIHMSAISSSGIPPLDIFRIIVRSEEYKFSRLEFKKLLNLINFQGYDIITALKKTARTSPSSELRELLDGLAITITSGGNLHDFLDKHAESLLFDYRLEREKYTRASETFMDIYISIVIAAPMILLMLFVIMGSTGMYFMGLSPGIMSFLIILVVIFLNIAFLVFLRVKQPVF